MSYGHDLDVQKSYPRPYSNHVGQSSETEPILSCPRGPPRKPKQSGHALWVGNLPASTTVGALKDHFSREATGDIESVFLISKSNCAFVNYQSEAACFAAMDRFHNSRFQGVRLVCRPRHSTPVSESSHPLGSTTQSPGKLVETSPQIADFKSFSDLVIVDGSARHSYQKEPQQDVAVNLDGVNGYGEHSSLDSARVPENYFIVKSLTLQDLEASVRSGVWASQSRNKSALNHAYETADNVFLVFSANKSGEYFGYARMISPITSAASPCSASLQPKTRDTGTGPECILTLATQWAPRGRIVDDSARGTIFWEVERGESGHAFGDFQAQQQEKGSKQTQDWGESFEVGWISTTRLSFYRTRGLRNPWNENKEIKIARDGTEIEPSIGRRLVQMFHQAAQPLQGARSMPPNITPATPHSS
ncbi:hypothetical protein E4T44_13048 [Aureobasidium sp. EXF-8845]|nr:hypothetical protein E4T44_13048 [Aureobasidium sp. EXF-8845]